MSMNFNNLSPKSGFTSAVEVFNHYVKDLEIVQVSKNCESFPELRDFFFKKYNLVEKSKVCENRPEKQIRTNLEQNMRNRYKNLHKHLKGTKHEIKDLIETSVSRHRIQLDSLLAELDKETT